LARISAFTPKISWIMTTQGAGCCGDTLEGMATYAEKDPPSWAAMVMSGIDISFGF
jgi:hypothetical protein